ncbi:LytTR family DNA-binding domain-containing protein [Sphingomonas koreensis]
MNELGQVTSGGESGPHGDPAARRRLILALAGLFALMVVLQFISNYSTMVTDLRRGGAGEPAWHVAVWQGSSTLVWLLLVPVVWQAVARIQPLALGWPRAIVLHALLTIPVSLVHVFGMIALRHLAYAVAGESYQFTNDWGAALLYEYKKDVVTYVTLALFAAAAQWALRRGGGAAPLQAPADMLEIPDGKVVLHIPLAEIGWAAAAGNYVEIGWRERTVLQRSTLAAIAERLGAGFVRIHRGRIVRRDAIRSVETERSGDFVVTLGDGTTLRGSRRYRGAI